MVLFCMFFGTYGFTMYVCFPRAGDYAQPQAPNFGTLGGALLELVELALTGDPIKVRAAHPLYKSSPVLTRPHLARQRHLHPFPPPPFRPPPFPPPLSHSLRCDASPCS